MIRGELTNLRAVERSDAGLLHRWFNDPDLMRYWGIPSSTVSRAEMERRIEAWIDDEHRFDRPVCLMIELLDGGAVGVAILSRFERQHGAIELSLLIGDREQWGKGYGSDSLSALVETCFEQWNLHRLTVRVEAFNERARALYERAGFHLDATLRQASYFDGAYHDVLVYSLLSTDRARTKDELA